MTSKRRSLINLLSLPYLSKSIWKKRRHWTNCSQNSVVRDRSLFIPQGGTEEKLKKVYIKNLPNHSWCSKFFYPTSNRNPRF